MRSGAVRRIKKPDMTNAPFHSGELAVQERAGEAAIARRNGSAVSGKVMGGARLFLTQQPMIVLSSSDEKSAMWASIVFGRPGFLASEDGASLDIDLNRALVDPRDPLWANVGAKSVWVPSSSSLPAVAASELMVPPALMRTTTLGLTSRRVSRLAQSTLHADTFESRL